MNVYIVTRSFSRFYLNFFILFLFFLYTPLLFSQTENYSKAFKEYTSTSENAINELYKCVGDDKIKIEKVLVYINELKKDKIYVLSTEEYLPIKKRIDYFNNNHESFSLEEYKLEKAYTSKLSYNYRVITDLIKMEL